MTIAIISDTHMPRGDRRLPDACLERLRDAEAIIHAGDLSTLAVLAMLQRIGPPVTAVHGNVDDAEVRLALPSVAVLTAGAQRIVVVHDAGPAPGRLARLRRRFPDADVVVFGHSHLPLHETGDDGLQIVNPGSPTERRRAPAHTMALAEATPGAPLDIRLVELD